MEIQDAPSVNTPSGEIKTKKFYTSGWVIFATYLGGPLAGGYVMSKNFENLGNKEYAKKTLYIGAVSTLVLLTTFALLPNSIMDKIPKRFFPIVYISIVYGLMVKYQDKTIKEQIASGAAKKYSGWKASGIGLLSFIIIAVYFFMLIFLLPESIILK